MNEEPYLKFTTNVTQENYRTVGSFQFTRNLTSIYYIAGFQHMKSNQNMLMLQLIISEYWLALPETHRVLQTETSAGQYMLYYFLVGYNRTQKFFYDELEDLVDLLMKLIFGCSDFCNDCSIFRNSTQCLSCSGNRIPQGGLCVCNLQSDITLNCVNKCDGCQPCIQDCYSCVDNSKFNYSDVCPKKIKPQVDQTKQSQNEIQKKLTDLNYVIEPKLTPPPIQTIKFNNNFQIPDLNPPKLNQSKTQVDNANLLKSNISLLNITKFQSNDFNLNIKNLTQEENNFPTNDKQNNTYKEIQYNQSIFHHQGDPNNQIPFIKGSVFPNSIFNKSFGSTQFQNQNQNIQTNILSYESPSINLTQNLTNQYPVTQQNQQDKLKDPFTEKKELSTSKTNDQNVSSENNQNNTLVVKGEQKLNNPVDQTQKNTEAQTVANESIKDQSYDKIKNQSSNNSQVISNLNQTIKNEHSPQEDIQEQVFTDSKTKPVNAQNNQSSENPQGDSNKNPQLNDSLLENKTYKDPNDQNLYLENTQSKTKLNSLKNQSENTENSLPINGYASLDSNKNPQLNDKYPLQNKTNNSQQDLNNQHLPLENAHNKTEGLSNQSGNYQNQYPLKNEPGEISIEKGKNQTSPTDQSLPIQNKTINDFTRNQTVDDQTSLHQANKTQNILNESKNQQEPQQNTTNKDIKDSKNQTVYFSNESENWNVSNQKNENYQNQSFYQNETVENSENFNAFQNLTQDNPEKNQFKSQITTGKQQDQNMTQNQIQDQSNLTESNQSQQRNSSLKESPEPQIVTNSATTGQVDLAHSNNQIGENKENTQSQTSSKQINPYVSPNKPNLNPFENNQINQQSAQAASIKGLEMITPFFVKTGDKMETTEQQTLDQQKQITQKQIQQESSSLLPVVATISSVCAAGIVLVAAYVLILKKPPNRFIKEKGVDLNGNIWPQQKFLAPKELKQPNWEITLSNEQVDRYLQDQIIIDQLQ